MTKGNQMSFVVFKLCCVQKGPLVAVKSEDASH